MTEYVTFTENNDAELETWHFYIPTYKNQPPLMELGDLLELTGNNSTYKLDMATIPENIVDILVGHANGDTFYLDAHHKLDGVLTLTPAVRDFFTSDIGDDPLALGGIRNFMTVQLP